MSKEEEKRGLLLHANINTATCFAVPYVMQVIFIMIKTITVCSTLRN